MRINVKTVLLCAKTDFSKWLFNARMITLAALAVFIYVFAVEPLSTNAELMGKPLNALEPFIAALNSGSLMLIIPLGFLAVSSDFPKIGSAAMFGIIRTGRLNWLLGQLMESVMMCAAYLFFIFAASTVQTAFTGFWGSEWSDVALHFTQEFPEQAMNFGALLLPQNLYNQLSLTDAALQSTAFVFAYLVTLEMILLFFTIIGKKTAGVVVCGSVIGIGTALCSIRSEFMWMFPMANSVVWLHYTEFRRKPFYPIWCSWLYFGIIIAFFLIFAFIMLKRSDCFISAAEEV